MTSPRVAEHIESGTNPTVAIRSILPSLPPAERRVAEGILAQPGDRVIIAAYADLEDAEVPLHEPRVLVVRGDDNRRFEVRSAETPRTRVAP